LTAVEDLGKDIPGEAGDYLKNFKSSPTPAELVEAQAKKGGTNPQIDIDHILNGQINSRGNAVGGHYLRDPDVKVNQWTGAPDVNGVRTGYISVRDPNTGKWIPKKAETTFFPEHWSKRQCELEVKNAFENSHPVTINGQSMWEGKSSNGITMRGYYKVDGSGATGWPVYRGK
jgi:filamentous hemagglutinin